MTLPPARTAPQAIRSLARWIRTGVEASRQPDMALRRRRQLARLKRRHAARSTVPFPVHGPGRRANRILRVPCHYSTRIVLPTPPRFHLPPTWNAEFFERVSWPAAEPDPARHPFHLFLEVSRLDIRPVSFPVHDMRDPWLGPTVKSRLLRSFLQPDTGSREPFPRRISTYLVYGDELSEGTLCQWLSVLLAQRVLLLTEDEESMVISAFFATPRKAERDEWAQAKLDAYMHAKRNFVQPIGGRPSFPAYLESTVKKVRRAARFAARLDAGDDESADAQRGLLESVPDPNDALQAYRDRSTLAYGEQRALDRVESAVALSWLRRHDPRLHRALLYRIRRGRVETIDAGTTPCVSVETVKQVQAEREKNADVRRPLRLVTERKEWIDTLRNSGLTKKSARRRVQRWINTLHLSAEEINASLARGRVVRRPRPSQPS